MVSPDKYKWLIVTSADLPEAYYLARFLMNNSQRTAILNIKDRTFRQKITVLKKLAVKRGLLYMLDFFLARLLRKYYQKPCAMPFPEITESVIHDIRANNLCYDCADPHGNEALAFVKNYAPDYMLVSGAPVLRPALFGLAKYGAVNWHHGLSPGYRGSDCELWPMARKDFDNIGFTIHFVSERVDGGGIILQRKVALRKDHGFSEALAYINFRGMEGYIEVVRDLMSGSKIISIEQEKGGAHYPPAGLSAIRRACKNYKEFKRSLSEDVTVSHESV
ncbi:MAG: hypothetical protein HZB61_03110 [Nitrospirae bacterium]|nr:hypothetical protein [Nitrospirota bacterium]